MDEFLSKAGSQAATFAIKSGISIASSYAIKTVATFVTKIPEEDASKLDRLRSKLETRIDIVSPAIDLVRLVAAKGNTNLEGTLKLTRTLKEEIDSFDSKIATITENYHSKKNQRQSIVAVEEYLNDLLSRIDEVIPLINLSLTISGANLSTALPQNVSPGRLLQASDLINENNRAFDNATEVQVGPTFELTLFSIFYHLQSAENAINGIKPRITWKEDFKKALVTLRRRPTANDRFDYYVKIQESFQDGRYHDTDEEKEQVIIFDIWKVLKLFFSASGKLLKLEDRNSAVLVLKVDQNLKSSSPEAKTSSTEDLIWYAFGECDVSEDDNDDSDEDDEHSETDNSASEEITQESEREKVRSRSISLLEYMIRLASLQCSDQESILNIRDERLAMYLTDENASSVKSKKYNVEEVTSRLQKIKLASDDTPNEA
ncbi:LAMI_0A04104g1_1 [Lachancea mirantina]|uniref:LAMI_0A04104g1_1 n=1 Tax=Lachancea mirantina TaxID=1230905 RepID=A0A1G4INN1_9SACH|nr:LAMI_0A04104g1_1 [Lachancea mirantina]